jgi:hypothetical protein
LSLFQNESAAKRAWFEDYCHRVKAVEGQLQKDEIEGKALMDMINRLVERADPASVSMY